MSNISNDRLLEEANYLCDYWDGTLHAALIRNALEDLDLEVLEAHVKLARREMLDIEFNPTEAVDTY